MVAQASACGFGATSGKNPQAEACATDNHRTPNSSAELFGKNSNKAWENIKKDYNERKFFSNCIPTSVSTDSGWNCTPSISNLR